MPFLDDVVTTRLSNQSKVLVKSHCTSFHFITHEEFGPSI